MSFKDLKKSSSDNMKHLLNEAEKLKKGGEGSYEDNRIWKPTLDKSSNGFAVIRFLPAAEGEDLWDEDCAATPIRVGCGRAGAAQVVIEVLNSYAADAQHAAAEQDAAAVQVLRVWRRNGLCRSAFAPRHCARWRAFRLLPAFEFGLRVWGSDPQLETRSPQEALCKVVRHPGPQT